MNADFLNSGLPITGSGGGGGKAGGGSQSKESPNTLRSNSRIRMVELLGEGPIVGLVNGAQSIYFDNTPLQNPDGTYNFGGEINGGDQGTTGGSGVAWDTRLGYPDQPYLPGTPMAETPFSVEVRVRASTAPLVRTISELNADAVRVVVRVPALAHQDREKGDLNSASVAWAVEFRGHGGEWQTAEYVNIQNQKCTSPYLRQTRVQLPEGGYPWEIRVRRITADSDTVDLQNETWWESYTVISEGKFIYPDSALIAMEINSREFGSSVPARTYDVKGLIIKVPSNYNPETREYSGIWDGSFKNAWTDNPAWVFYDLITNRRYGLGEYIEEYRVDKWGLYVIAQYCDQLVPSGYKNSITGLDILEPRFTFNGVLNSRDEAYKVLQSITQTFRGMAYWTMGMVTAVADMPVDPVKIVTPANVIGGHFQYSGTAMKARHSVALVKWNDPQDFYRPGVELIQNDDMLQRFGWRQDDIQAVGCTSRGQAHRLGKWKLDTEQHETETVEYSCSWDQADLLPGQIILISDPRKAQVRAGGRLADVSTHVFTLDRGFAPVGANTYNLIVTLPDGSTASSPIVEFVPTSIQDDGTYKQVRVLTPYSAIPLKGAMFVISGTDVEPMRWRVLSIMEEEKNTFKVTALFHDPTKYARVEQDILFDPPPYTRPRAVIRPPVNLRAVESLFYQSGVARSRIGLSWTPSDDFLAVAYLVSAQTPDGFQNYGQFSGTSCDIDEARAGRYTFYVSSLSMSGATSKPAVLEFDAAGWEGLDGPFVSHLEIFGRGSDPVFTGRDPKFVWRNNFPGVAYDAGSEPNGAGTGYVNPLYRDNVVRVFDVETNDLLRTQVVRETEFIYSYSANVQDNARFQRGPQRKFRIEVTVRDTLGRESKPAKLVAKNPVPDLVVPTVRPGLEQIFVDFPLSQDLDAQGALIWLSTDQAFDPLTTAPAYDGINNFVSLKGVAFATYYVRMAIYDAFGRDGLNICPPIEVTVDGFVIDIEPPAIPTGLTLRAYTERGPTGEIGSRLVAEWDVSPSENFSRFDVDIRRAGGNFISQSAASNRFEWLGLTMNATYEVRVRAQSRNGFGSAYSAVASITMPANEQAPGKPTSLTALASLRSVFLKWENPLDTDLAAIEIWASTTNSLANATKIGESLTNAFTHSGLTTGVAMFYWVRARNTSGLQSPYNATAGLSVTPGQVGEGDIAAGTIIAEHVRAGTLTGDLLKIDTYLPSTIVVGQSGVSIGTVENRSSDPAARINQRTTQIDPGKILIFGDTTLASWRNGTDATKIEGGSVAANSLAANTLKIGLRGLDIAGIAFSFDKTTNVVSWTAGTIFWVNDAGQNVTTQVAAGSATWTTGTLHIAWSKGQTMLMTTTILADVSGPDWVRFATYRGATQLIANYGRTNIDGDQIIAGTITAQALYAGELITDKAQIRGGIIQNVHLAGNITFDKMSGGTLSAADLIRVGGDRFVLDAANSVMRISDGNNTLRARLGRLGVGITDYGLELYDATGAKIFGSGGFVAGSIPELALGTVSVGKISGLGALATRSGLGVNEIAGIGALASKNGLDISEIASAGSFARISNLNAANISTYISSAAISDAFIANLSGDKILANTIGAGQIAAGQILAYHLTAGQVITGSAQIGNALINSAHIQDLTVDTIHIKNQAITTASSSSGTGSTIGVSAYIRGGARVVCVASFVSISETVNFNSNMDLYMNDEMIERVPVVSFVTRVDGSPEGGYNFGYRHQPTTFQKHLNAPYTGWYNFVLTNPYYSFSTTTRISLLVLEFAR